MLRVELAGSFWYLLFKVIGVHFTLVVALQTMQSDLDKSCSSAKERQLLQLGPAEFRALESSTVYSAVVSEAILLAS